MSWSGHIFLIPFINSSQMRLMSNLIFKAKLVVSCCAFCKLQWDFGFFCSINHFIEGGVYVNHSVMCLSSLAENDSRLLKNSKGNRDGERTFYQRKEADVSLFLQVTRIRKVRKIWEANLTSWLLPKTGRSQSNEPWNTKQTTRIEIHQNSILMIEQNAQSSKDLTWQNQFWTERYPLTGLTLFQSLQIYLFQLNYAVHWKF